MMTSPADKATDDVRGLVERLRAFADHLEPAEDMYGQEIADVRSAVATLTSLLERAERAERRAEELADGLMYVTVDHTGCIYTTADEDRAIKLAKDNLVEAERNARERAEARIKELDEALEPFARYLDTAHFDLDHKGEPLPDDQGVGWVYLTIGDFRRARSMKGGEG